MARQRLGQDTLAIARFRAALRADPQNALAHYDLGISLGNLHRDQDAERELDLATKLQPWFSRAHVARDSALKIDADDFDALLNRGNLRGTLGEWDTGHLDLEHTRSIEPDSAEVQEALGTLAFRRGDLDGALQEYKQALSLAPNSSSIHSDLGLLYRRLRRMGESRAEFQRALALDPTNVDAKHGLQ